MHNSSSKHTSALRITRGLGLLLKNVKGQIFTCTFLVCSYEIFTKHKHILVTPTISASVQLLSKPSHSQSFLSQILSTPISLWPVPVSAVPLWFSGSDLSPLLSFHDGFSATDRWEKEQITGTTIWKTLPFLIPHRTGHCNGACWEFYQGSCGRISLLETICSLTYSTQRPQ